MNGNAPLYPMFLATVVLGGYSGGGDPAFDAGAVRAPAVAGQFYPGTPAQLKERILSLLKDVPAIKPSGRIWGAMAPHAGYVFSGPVAAWTHKAIAAADFDTLVVIGHDSHRPAVAFLSPAAAYRTPLDDVPVDREMVSRLLAYNPGIRTDADMHAREHTVEVHLPFLQALGKSCKVVPILFGDPTAENCLILADAIEAGSAGRKVLVLASTDMSHYPPYEDACRLDKSTLEILREMDVPKLFAHLARGDARADIPNVQTAMCARGGVGTALFYAKKHGANQAEILKYANSGDVPEGDRSGVVGYSSVLFVACEQAAEAAPGR